MSHQSCCHHQASAPSTAQTLDEMDFERGLWSAALDGDCNRVTKLVRDGHKVNGIDSAGYAPIHYAARGGHVDVCRYLLENGANVNIQTRGGVTALHRAAYQGHIEVVNLLLKHKADPGLCDNDGRNALHKACERGRRDVFELLRSTTPKLQHVPDNRGNTAEDLLPKS